MLAAVFGCGLLGLMVAWRTAGRRPESSSRAAWLGLLTALGLIVGATLLRYGFPPGFSPTAVVEWPVDQTRQFLADPFSSDQIVLNIALFVPAGLFLTRVTGRPIVSIGWLILGSLLIELLQAMFGVGANDASDIVANAAGATAGASLAVVLSWVFQAEGRDRRPTLRHVVGWLSSIAGVLVLIIGVANARANAVADRLEIVLADEFGGSTLSDYRQWEEVGTVSDVVFDAVEPRADGVERAPERVSVRFPASFLGAHRCVFVTWRPEGVATEVVGGAPCVRFLG